MAQLRGPKCNDRTHQATQPLALPTDTRFAPQPRPHIRAPHNSAQRRHRSKYAASEQGIRRQLQPRRGRSRRAPLPWSPGTNCAACANARTLVQARSRQAVPFTASRSSAVDVRASAQPAGELLPHLQTGSRGRIDRAPPLTTRSPAAEANSCASSRRQLLQLAPSAFSTAAASGIGARACRGGLRRSCGGAPGPGETRMPLGFMARSSSTVFSSFLKTTYSQPRSPRYCGSGRCAVSWLGAAAGQHAMHALTQHPQRAGCQGEAPGRGCR